MTAVTLNLSRRILNSFDTKNMQIYFLLCSFKIMSKKAYSHIHLGPIYWQKISWAYDMVK